MSDLYFSLGNENNRGTLPSTINKIMEGQLSVGISSKRPGVRNKGKLISGTTYDNWHLTENTSKDARAYLDISDTERIPLNAYFSDYSHFATCVEAISNYNNLKKSYLLGTTGTDTTPIYDTDIFISNITKGALTSKYLLLNNSLGIGVTDFVEDRAFHVKGNSKLEGISEFASGHLYLTGAAANSSTTNTTQIVFGTSTDNHIAISSSANALVLNPDVSTTTNQIVLYLDKVSQIPSGISTGSLVVTGNTTLGNSSTADTFKVNAITTHNGVVYFANGNTYYIDNSAQGKLYNLSLTANTTSTSTTTGTLKVTGGAGISENVYIGGLLNVAGNTTLGDTSSTDILTVNAISTFNGTSTFNSSITSNSTLYFGGTTYYINSSGNGKLNSLTVNGNAILGDDISTDTVTINATTTVGNCIEYTTEGSSKRIFYGSVRNSGMKYDYGGNECLIFSSGSYATSSIQFYTSNRISLNDSSSQWNASTATPDLHLKNGCVAINYNWNSNTPAYNLYVNGSSYFAGDIVVTSDTYGSDLPGTGTTGQIFFKLI